MAVSRKGTSQSHPAVVCLHAIGHGGRDFEAFVERNQNRYEIISIDWPGQGRSDPDRVPVSSVRYAHLLHLVLEKLGITRPVIIGCSIGGAAAIRYASTYPVSGLVLCNSGGLIPSSIATRLFCNLMSRFFGAGARGARWFPAMFRLYYRNVLATENAEDQRQRITDSWREIAPVLKQAWENFSSRENELCRTVCELDLPILVAWAMQDRILPFALNRSTIKRLNKATIRKFQGGHAAFLEQPDDFCRDFEVFFTHVLASSARQ